jgi:hypothetical protein
MGRVFRLTLVWAITIALTASAAAWSQCPEIQSIASALAVHNPGHHVHPASVGEHDRHEMHHHHGAGGKPAPTTAGHDCIKCCALCMAAGAVLPTAVETASPAISPAVFRPDHEYWSPNTIAIDPGIPKRIA